MNREQLRQARLTQERDAARAEVEKLRETLAKIREVLG